MTPADDIADFQDFLGELLDAHTGDVRIERLLVAAAEMASSEQTRTDRLLAVLARDALSEPTRRTLAADRDPDVRCASWALPGWTPQELGHMVAHEAAAEVRLVALRHPGLAEADYTAAAHPLDATAAAAVLAGIAHLPHDLALAAVEVCSRKDAPTPELDGLIDAVREPHIAAQVGASVSLPVWVCLAACATATVDATTVADVLAEVAHLSNDAGGLVTAVGKSGFPIHSGTASWLTSLLLAAGARLDLDEAALHHLDVALSGLGQLGQLSQSAAQLTCGNLQARAVRMLEDAYDTDRLVELWDQLPVSQRSPEVVDTVVRHRYCDVKLFDRVAVHASGYDSDPLGTVAALKQRTAEFKSSPTAWMNHDPRLCVGIYRGTDRGRLCALLADLALGDRELAQRHVDAVVEDALEHPHAWPRDVVAWLLLAERAVPTPSGSVLSRAPAGALYAAVTVPYRAEAILEALGGPLAQLGADDPALAAQAVRALCETLKDTQAPADAIVEAITAATTAA